MVNDETLISLKAYITDLMSLNHSFHVFYTRKYVIIKTYFSLNILPIKVNNDEISIWT